MNKSKRLIDGDKLVNRLLDLYNGTGDRAEKYSYGRIEQEIESGKYDIPSDQGEVKRLRESLEKIVDVLSDDTSINAQRINNIIIQALASHREDTGIRLRPEVKWFAEQMERTLRVNDHKGGWENCTAEYLVDRLDEESKELYVAIGSFGADSLNRIISEASDVANFAMMIADKARRTDGITIPGITVTDEQ